MASFHHRLQFIWSKVSMPNYHLISKDDHIKGDWWSWRCQKELPCGTLIDGYIQADGGANLVAYETFEPDEEVQTPTEDEIVFGKDMMVYCSQHMGPHSTGWCTVAVSDKLGLGLKNTQYQESMQKCRYHQLKLAPEPPVKCPDCGLMSNDNRCCQNDEDLWK